ncbi:hypothetical protein D3C73_1267480 [compost metagenome]
MRQNALAVAGTQRLNRPGVDDSLLATDGQRTDATLLIAPSDQFPTVTHIQGAHAGARVERVARQNRRALAIDVNQRPGERDTGISAQGQCLYAKGANATAIARPGIGVRDDRATGIDVHGACR